MNSSNQRGASIIEVMIMSGAMVTMMMGFMSLVNHETKNVSYLEDKLSRVALESELRMQFANPDYCTSLLKDLVAPSKNKIRSLASVLTKPLQQTALLKVFTQRGKDTVYDQLKMASIRIENSDLTAPNSSGLVDLVFYPERIRKGGGPPNLQPIRIKTAVNVGAGYKIESCGAEDGEDTEGSCKTSYTQSQWEQMVRASRLMSGFGYRSKECKEEIPKLAPGGFLPEGTAYMIYSDHKRYQSYNRVYKICINKRWASIEIPMPAEQRNYPNGSGTSF